MRVDGPSIPRFKRASRLALTLCAAIAALAGVAPAEAHAPPAPPHYSLAILEGESTMPQNSIVHTSASVQPPAPISVSLIRGGIVIVTDSGGQYAGFSQVPAVGDIVNVESPPGAVVGSVVYDGLPSIDPAVCVGSAAFSGQRSAGQTVIGGYYSFHTITSPYGQTSVAQTGFGNAQVTLLAGSTYAGSFLAPLVLGQTVYAVESLDTPLAGGAIFSYSSENDRPVGACPLPPPPVVVPAPPALQGTLARLARTTIRRLLRFGWLTHVTINQPGTVTEGLYLQGGRLPAFAARRRHGRPVRPAALLLAHGSASAASAGEVNVVLHLTVKGRRRLKHAHRVSAVLITTLHSRSGAELNLARRTVTLHS